MPVAPAAKVTVSDRGSKFVQGFPLRVTDLIVVSLGVRRRRWTGAGKGIDRRVMRASTVCCCRREVSE